jgi:vacuolar-type H+-ATPase subunit F/Vma7
MFGYIIGSSDMITGFKLVGLEGAEVSSIEEAQQAFNVALARNDVAVIIVSEAFSTKSPMREQVDKTRQERVTPLIVEIPAAGSKTSEIQISDVISKTLGIKL